MIHSPSSIKLAMQCRRAWWLRYREKLKAPELTWAQVKRAERRGDRLPVGARSKALGVEMHRLAEIYLSVPPSRVARACKGSKYFIDWHDLPGQCLAELAQHLPPAGSVPRNRLERRVRVTVDGVQFQGLIDLILDAGGRALPDSADHKSSGDIRKYALLPHGVAVAYGEPTRSLRDDLQACLYTLARASKTAPGGLCRWNYSETKRRRVSLPVVQFIPTAHARTHVRTAAQIAREVEAYAQREDAPADTTACDDYGGCWYRAEGHCKVPRKWGAVLAKREREKRAEKERMSKTPTLNQLRKDTAAANEREEREARKAAAKAKAKRLAAAEAEEDEQDEDEPESEPAPAPKASKRKPAPAPEPEEDAEQDAEDADEDDAEQDAEDADEDADEDDAEPESVPDVAPAKSARAAARDAVEAALTPADHIVQFFNAEHAPPHPKKGLAATIVQGFAELAAGVADLERNPERHMALRQLLQARDCAVRACTGAK